MYTQMIEKLDEGVKYFLLKLALPALVAIAVKLAFMAQKVKLSYVIIILNIIIGVGMVYLCSDLLIMYCSPHLLTIVSAIIAITSEKIAYYMIYKFKIDVFISAFFDTLISKMKK